MKAASRLDNMPVYPFARWGGYVEAVRQRRRPCAIGMASGTESVCDDVIRLDIGGPDLPPPQEVIDVLCEAARQPGAHEYPGYRGLPSLRQAIASHYWQRFGVELDPESEIVPLLGSKEGIINLALACLDAGGLALVPDPGYAPYAMGAALAGAKVQTFPLLPELGFLPNLDAIPAEVADRADLLWLNYPNNPTGATADLEFFGQAVDYARRHGLLLCHDAPYCDIVYDGYVAPSLLQVPRAAEVAVEFNSLSKAYNMPGWRLGMAVGNAEALSLLGQVKSNMDSGIYRPLQEAAVQALSTGSAWIEERNAIYRERQQIILRGLQALGLEARQPSASLYVWSRIPSGWAAEAFALAVLQETGVVLAPGSFFGQRGEGYMRLSVTTPADRIQEAMERLVRSWDRILDRKPGL